MRIRDCLWPLHCLLALFLSPCTMLCTKMRSGSTLLLREHGCVSSKWRARIGQTLFREIDLLLSRLLYMCGFLISTDYQLIASLLEFRYFMYQFSIIYGFMPIDQLWLYYLWPFACGPAVAVLNCIYGFMPLDQLWLSWDSSSVRLICFAFSRGDPL